jgi:transposase
MDMQQITKISLAWEMFQGGIPQLHIAKQLGIDRITIYRWVKGIHAIGDIEVFLDKYLSCKKGPRKKRKVDGLLKVRIWNLREKYRDCCGQKIQYFLKQEHGVTLGIKAIYKILGEKYKLRSKWKKNQKRGVVPKADKKREVVQMDTIDFGEIFAFTGVDIFSKEVDVLLAPELTSQFGYEFLKQSMTRRFDNFVEMIQTDGGPEFKDEFKKHVLQYTERHRVARPYKKNEQSYIESFNRSFRKECLGWSKYKVKELPILEKEVEQYLAYYHKTRPHISLGMRPPLEQ